MNSNRLSDPMWTQESDTVRPACASDDPKKALPSIRSVPTPRGSGASHPGTGGTRCVTFLLAALLAPLACADVPGYTEPYKTITVSAAEAGVIKQLPVEEGSVVKQGQLLAQLDVAQLEAELDIAMIQAGLQRTKVERLDELARSQRAAKEELDRARGDMKIREAEIRKLQAGIETRTMRSPVDGIVTEIKRDPSEAISLANPHVLTVVQIDRLLVNLFLTPQRAAKLKVGGAASLMLGEGSQKVPATVEFISPVTDAASGTVRVKFVVENAAGKLRSGVTALLAE